MHAMYMQAHGMMAPLASAGAVPEAINSHFAPPRSVLQAPAGVLPPQVCREERSRQ
jgi:hypothetical protein